LPWAVTFRALPADNTPSGHFRGQGKEGSMRRILLAVTVAAVVLVSAGTARTTTNGVPEPLLDVEATLGMKDEDIPFGEAFLRLGGATLRIGYTELAFDGNRTLADAITFNGRTFTAPDNVVSRVDMEAVGGE